MTLSDKISQTLSEEFSESNHDEIMRMLADSKPSEMSLSERFKALSYLQTMVTFIAKGNDLYKNGIVDEDIFKDEIREMHRFARTTQYSPATAHWMDARRSELVESLLTDSTFVALTRQWNNSLPADRAKLLSYLSERQTEIYAKDALPFAPPRTVVSPQSGDCWTISPRIEKITGAGDIVINFGHDFLAEATLPQALMLAQHETVHYLMAQLALAARDGHLLPAHLLYNDALMRLARMQEHYNAHSAIDSVYLKDGEETLAYGECCAFAKDFFERLRPQTRSPEPPTHPC